MHGTGAISSVEVWQLTDAHLGSEPGSRLLGVDTDRSLQAVVRLAQRERPRPDLLLATGDLSDRGAPTSYSRFAAHTRGLAERVTWLPGNHDDPVAMRAEQPGGVQLCGHRTLGDWLIVALDSQVAGEVGGALAPAELERLERLLQRHPDMPTLLCLHHQVLPVGCLWLDRQRLANASELLALVTRHAQVKAMLSGHVHQESEQDLAGIRVLTSPSTCVQFSPASDDFKVDTAAPGYRWLRLYSDGRLETGVSRLAAGSFRVDLQASGY